MAEVVRIIIRPGEDMASVRCYQARHLVSALPMHLRHWDQLAKVWRVDTWLVSGLADDMRRAGFTVVIDGELDQAPDTWADLMYQELPPPLADAAYRALLRVLHPDTGGDDK
jgi:hypothetical protein